VIGPLGDHAHVPARGSDVLGRDVTTAQGVDGIGEVAQLLQARGILWAPDFVANAGGIINIAQELSGYDVRAARTAVRRIGPTLHTVFERAETLGATPLEAALELARSRMAVAGRSGARRRSAVAI
jgi:glutamate dehydrogenase/leucine dehydrogenase